MYVLVITCDTMLKYIQFMCFILQGGILWLPSYSRITAVAQTRLVTM